MHERVLDLCAAPGGKCTHLAERMADEGEVWAMERAESRMVVARGHRRSDSALHAIHVVRGDGRTYTFPMPFDRVLVDAPCSGLGVLGRRADARWRKAPEILREMPPLQLELLMAGGRRARPGGVLVYSVCSFEPEETTELVERFLHAESAVRARVRARRAARRRWWPRMAACTCFPTFTAATVPSPRVSAAHERSPARRRRRPRTGSR